MPCSSTPARMRSSTCGASVRLDDDDLDAFEVQQVREQQTRRSGADDADLRANGRCGPSHALAIFAY